MRRFAWPLALLLTVVAAVWLFRPKPGPLSAPAVLAQVQELNQLATVNYTVQKIVALTEPKIPVGEESILLVVQASVQAGVDLKSLGPRDVSLRPDGTVVIRLPEAKILKVSIDEKETKVWDRKMTWWTPWVPYSLDLEKKARLEGLDIAQKAAIEMGILKQAERSAETSIRGLLKLAGVSSVVLVPGSAS